jgi:hypothetical protein
MKTKHRIIQWLALLALATLNSQPSTASAQGTTAFTYQGQLRDGGTNANGAYTMIFKLYDAVTSGNQIGTGITNNPTLGNGLFSVNLDFGAGAFNGSARWLDITISNGGVTQTLSPRVQVLPAPYAQFAAVAATVTNGAITTAQLAANSVTTANLANGAVTNRSLTANAVNATNIASGQVVKSLNGLTDNVILSAGANVALFTNGNALQLSAGVPKIQGFMSSGTFIVPTNVTRIMVELWGGGGGGGSGYSADPYHSTGGGGGSGGYALNVFNVTPGASYPVTIGSGGGGGASGGTTSFGALMSAGGGSHGAAASALDDGSGGSGGSSSGGLFPSTGNEGERGGNGATAPFGGVGGWIGGSDGHPAGGGGGGGAGGDITTPGSGAFGIVIVSY